MAERIALYNDSFQNWKSHYVEKAQLILTDIPYQLGTNMYGSNPMWYEGGDNKNGESKLAGANAFDTDTKSGFRISEFFHFCSNLLKKEPKCKEDGKAGCMILFCAYEQQEELIHYAEQCGFKHHQVFIFYKKYSAQVLKANMRAVGNFEIALLFYREKLPKFNNGGKMVFQCQPWIDDKITPKVHPTQKPVPLLESLIRTYTDIDDVVIDCCVDKETEYFDGKQWKKISEYKEGDNVLVFDMNNMQARIEKPIRYLKQKYEDDFIRYEGLGIDMKVTPNHRIVNYSTTNKLRFNYMYEVLEDNADKVLGFRGKVPLTFKVEEDNEEYDEWLLRLMVATQADGSVIKSGRTGKPLNTNHYRLRVIKERKAIRMRMLLEKSGVKWQERKEVDYRFDSMGKEYSYFSFRYYSPYGAKVFDKKFLHAKEKYRKIILDELKYWDGNEGIHNTVRYFTCNKDNADFIQLLAHSVGISARILEDKRNENICYTVSFSKYDRAGLSTASKWGTDYSKNIRNEKTDDGYCYCFEVSTGAFVVRRNGKIHITGNCAGSGTTLLASANLGRKAYGFELKREFVKAFYEKILPYQQEDMFVQAEREEKKLKQLELFGE